MLYQAELHPEVGFLESAADGDRGAPGIAVATVDPVPPVRHRAPPSRGAQFTRWPRSIQSHRRSAGTPATREAAENGLARGLAPLYTHEPKIGDKTDRRGLRAARQKIRDDIAADYVRIERLNPGPEAFADFGVAKNPDDGELRIPVDNLIFRSAEAGGSSGLSIQDANLLKLRVTYCYPLYVPFVNTMIVRLLSESGSAACEECLGPAQDAFQRRCLNAGRLPIVTQSLIRMQSDPWENW